MTIATEMVRYLMISLFICMFQGGCGNATTTQVLAFPGAEGFAAKTTTGGRGGKVIYVTNLNDSGPGSLRAAINAVGARYILFKVSGTIKLKSNLEIDNSNVTIAGQTAPGGGITIRNYSTIVDADNVIIRFIRFRMGDTANNVGDALTVKDNKNIIIDHCSISWGTDGTLTIYDNQNTIVQWCIISESLTNSIHPKGSHGYGGIWGGQKASFHHNLLADHSSRNPRFCGSRYTNRSDLELIDFRNNVIYNWGFNSSYGAEGGSYNMVNNYYKPGPATNSDVDARIVQPYSDDGSNSQSAGAYGKFYVHGNYVVGSSTVTNNNWKGVDLASSFSQYNVTKSDLKVSKPFDVAKVTTQSAKQAYQSVLKYAGASLVHDPVDKRIINEVRSGTYAYEGSKGSTGGIIDSQADVGGWPNLPEGEAPKKDTDGDGMPDSWEKKKGLNLSKYKPNGHDLHKGYTNIEVYLHSLVKEITKNQYK